MTATLLQLIREDPRAGNGILEFWGVTDIVPAMAVLNVDGNFYFSGAGISMKHGQPDDGRLTPDKVVSVARPILDRFPNVYSIADADVGFGSSTAIEQFLIDYSRAGIQAAHIEDQIDLKVCGWVEGKHVCSIDEMLYRQEPLIKARDKYAPGFGIIIRVDAFNAVNVGPDAGENPHGVYRRPPVEEAVRRIKAYVNAGADAIFLEAFPDEDSLTTCMAAAPDTPFLVNMTTGNKSPKLTPEQLTQLGVKMVIYPVALDRAAFAVYDRLLVHHKNRGTTKALESGDFTERSPVIANRSDVTSRIMQHCYQGK